MNLGSLIGYLGLDTKDWDQGLDKAQSGLANFAKKGAVAAAAAGVGIAAAVTGAVVAGMNIEAANDKLAAQLGASGQYAADLGKIAGSLYANAYGGSLEEVNVALRGVMQSGAVMKDASNAQIESITAKVLDLATAFDQDLGATTSAVGQMIRTGMAKDADEALDIITRGMQQGADASGDLLDTFVEYPALFQRLGLDGAKSMGLIEQAMGAGARNSDLAADALKEFQIRATDGSKTSADAFKLMGLNAKKMTAQIAGGGEGASAGLDMVLDRLRGMEDPVARNAAAVGIFGTQAEDLGEALFAMDPSEAVGALGEVAGAAAKMGQTLNDNASTNLESFKRQAAEAFVNIIGGKVLPIVTSIASTLVTQFGPALVAVGGFLTGTLVPALQSAAQWIGENKAPIMVIAGVIAAVFLPHLIALAAQAAITRTVVVASWLAQKAAAVGAAVLHSAQIAWMIVRFVALSAAAVLNAGLTIGAWIGMGIAAVAHAAIVAAAWVGAQIRTVASLAVMAAGFVAQGAVMLASTASTVAGVVAGWVLMGVQSMINAARMAAAWLIAMGPIGWVIAAVVGLVALIVANWDTVVSWTKKAWAWVVDAVKSGIDFLVNLFLNFTGPGLIIKHWDSIVAFTRKAWNAVTGAVSGAWNAVTGAISSGISTAVNFVKELPGKILGALGNLGSTLYNSGKDMIQGLLNGAGSLLRNIGRFFLDLVPGWIRGPFEAALGINSPSKVFAGYGKNIGQGLINGMAGMQPAVAAQMLKLADTQALGSLAVAGPSWSPGLGAPQVGAYAATSSASGAAGGPLFHADTVNVIEGTPQDIAQELVYQGRTRGW